MVLKYQHIQEEGYTEWDWFDMNPAALHGSTTVYHIYKIGDLEAKHTHDISGSSSQAPHPEFFARDCADGKSFEVIKKYPYSSDEGEVLGKIDIKSDIN